MKPPKSNQKTQQSLFTYTAPTWNMMAQRCRDGTRQYGAGPVGQWWGPLLKAAHVNHCTNGPCSSYCDIVLLFPSKWKRLRLQNSPFFECTFALSWHLKSSGLIGRVIAKDLTLQQPTDGRLAEWIRERVFALKLGFSFKLPFRNEIKFRQKVAHRQKMETSHTGLLLLHKQPTVIAARHSGSYSNQQLT